MTDQVQGYTFQYAYSNEIIQAFANVVQPAYPIEYNKNLSNLYIENLSSIPNNTQGTVNIGLGEFSLSNLTNGNYNVAIGQQTLGNNTSGSYNIGISESLGGNTTGNENIGIGFLSLNSNITGNYNIAIGSWALVNNSSGNYNIVIGNQGGYYLNVNNNIWIGSTSQPNLGAPYVYPLNNGSYGDNELFIAPKVGLIGGVDNNTLNGTTIIPSTSSYVIIYGELATSFGGTAPTSITAGASPYTFTPSSTTNQIVIISGGSVSSIALNGTTTGLTSGTFYCRAGDSLTITYTTAPTILQYNV